MNEQRRKRELLASAAQAKSRIHICLILGARLTALPHPKSALWKLLSSAGFASQCGVELIEKLRVAG